MTEHTEAADFAQVPDPTTTALAELAGRDWLTIEARIRELYAPECDETEWEIYREEAKALDLSPVRREYIPLVIGKQGNKRQYRGYITQTGLIALAERSGKLDAIEGPQWAGAHTNNQFVEFWLPEWGTPLAARATVWRLDKTRGTTAVVTMARAATYYNPETRKRELTAIWKKDPAMMLGVRATTDALKKSGLMTAIPEWETLRLATEAGDAIELESGLRTAGRRVHAIAAGRGLDHDDVHQVAVTLDQDTESLTDLDADAIHATADFIDLAPADTLAAAAGRHPTEIRGEERAVAPEPDQEPEHGGISAEQLAWLEERRDRIQWKRLTEEQKAAYDARKMLSYRGARDLIAIIGRNLERADDGGWTDFWSRAKEAGFANSRQLSKAVGGQVVPDDIEEAERLLEEAIATRDLGNR